MCRITRVGAVIGVGGSGYDGWACLTNPSTEIFMQHTRKIVDQVQFNFCGLKEWNLWMQQGQPLTSNTHKQRIGDVDHDVGRAINPTACEGQLEGSVAQGMGYGLLEQVEHKDGVMLNPGFSNYRVPTAMDVPRVSMALIEPIDPAGPFGAKGVAEPAMAPTAACIANAIYDAVGVRIKELPITPEKIWKALRDQEKKP